VKGLRRNLPMSTSLPVTFEKVERDVTGAYWIMRVVLKHAQPTIEAAAAHTREAIITANGHNVGFFMTVETLSTRHQAPERAGEDVSSDEINQALQVGGSHRLLGSGQGRTWQARAVMRNGIECRELRGSCGTELLVPRSGHVRCRLQGGGRATGRVDVISPEQSAQLQSVLYGHSLFGFHGGRRMMLTNDSSNAGTIRTEADIPRLVDAAFERAAAVASTQQHAESGHSVAAVPAINLCNRFLLPDNYRHTRSLIRPDTSPKEWLNRCCITSIIVGLFYAQLKKNGGYMSSNRCFMSKCPDKERAARFHQYPTHDRHDTCAVPCGSRCRRQVQARVGACVAPRLSGVAAAGGRAQVDEHEDESYPIEPLGKPMPAEHAAELVRQGTPFSHVHFSEDGNGDFAIVTNIDAMTTPLHPAQPQALPATLTTTRQVAMREAACSAVLAARRVLTAGAATAAATPRLRSAGSP